MNAKQQPWIEAGYKQIAKHGFRGITVEELSRLTAKSKSSFYHYFVSMEIFESDLLAYHIHRSKELARRAQQCSTVKPDLLEVLVEYKLDLLFHKQLRIHRDKSQYEECFKQAFKAFESGILSSWINYLGLQQHPSFARSYLGLIAENFLLQITEDRLSMDWLSNYVDEVVKSHLRT
jgi:AcrR family transcriptional regulator